MQLNQIVRIKDSLPLNITWLQVPIYKREKITALYKIHFDMNTVFKNICSFIFTKRATMLRYASLPLQKCLFSKCSKYWWCSKGVTSQCMFLSPYPSIVSSSKGAGLSHTGQVQVGFFSFICRKKTASKHWRWAQVRTRHGTPSRIFTSWREERTKLSVFKRKSETSTEVNTDCKISQILTGQMRETRRPVVAISLSGS